MHEDIIATTRAGQGILLPEGHRIELLATPRGEVELPFRDLDLRDKDDGKAGLAIRHLLESVFEELRTAPLHEVTFLRELLDARIARHRQRHLGADLTIGRVAELGSRFG